MSTLPARVQARLFRVDRPLLAERYRDALWRVNGRTTRLDQFHVDAVGYSPEVAAELAEPNYLGHGLAHPSFLILSVDQLDAPVLQPNAGFAAGPFRSWAAALRSELADLTLREAVYGEITHGVTRFAHPAQLGLVRGLSLAVHTPSERLEHALVLRTMKAELVENDTSWRDESFLAKMLSCAQKAQGWSEVPPGLVQGRQIACAASFSPAFGGCYVWPGGEADQPVAWVLCRATSSADAESWPALAEAAGVLLLPLTPESVVEFLADRKLLDMRAAATRFDAAELRGLQFWMAIDHFQRAGRLAPDVASDPLRAMRSEDTPPADYLELEDILLRIQNPSGFVDLSRYTALTRLRTMPLATDRAADIAWVRHLRAYLDPVHLTNTLEHASDLVLPLLARLAPETAAALDRQLAKESR